MIAVLKSLSNAQQRVLTASVLLPLALYLMIWAPMEVFVATSVLILFWSGMEWASLQQWGLVHRMQLQLWLSLCFYWSATQIRYWDLIAFYSVAFLGWCVAALLLACYPKGKYWVSSRPATFVWATLVLIPFWMALFYLRLNVIYPVAPLMYVMILVWVLDSSAYFVGKRWGKHPLCPQISPKKTWEGLLGGLCVTVLLGWGLTHCRYFYFLNDPKVIYVIVITALAAVLGDLFESMLKRTAGVKDSGALFPGHGGLLDRIDSLTAALPIFSLGLHWLRIL